MSDDPHTTPSEAFLRVLRGLLRPLVRTMIARGLTAPVIYSLLKRVFVEVAEESFRLDDKPLTDSRIALLTGVHRKDIRMIRAEGAGDGPVARRKSAVLATVVGQWMSQPEFSDGGGPRALPRSAAEDVDFEALVRSVNTDVRPRTVLDELLRAGLVRQDAQDMLHLQTDAVVGASTTGDREVFFAANVGDHLAAATENLLAAQPPFFERSVFYNQMTPEAVDEVEAAARVQAQAMLEDLNRRSSALHRRDKDSDAARQRYRVGVYFYKEDAAPAPPEEGQDTP